MRVVIDGLPIREDENLGRVVARLLQVWSQPHGVDDEVHLVIGHEARLVIPDWVVVHHVKAGRRGTVGRLYARAFGLRHLCRSLRAQVLLGLRPSQMLAAFSCPRGTVGYNLWHQPGAEQFSGTALTPPQSGIAWSRFAHRLRLSMVDALADTDWHARRFKIHEALLWPRPALAGGLTPFRRVSPHRLVLPSRRSARWIAAASASTLALSAAAAASVNLVTSHNIPVTTPHHNVSVTIPPHSATTGGGPSSTSPGTVHLPGTSSSTTPPTTAATQPAPTTSSSTATSAPATTTPASSVPGLSLPGVTLPTLTAPSLPLPKIDCATGATTTSAPRSLLQLCSITVGGLQLSK
jgi:hypothetical protein